MLKRLLIVGSGRQGARHFDVATRTQVAQHLVTVDPILKPTVSGEGTLHEHFFDLESALAAHDYEAAIVATPTMTHRLIVERLLLLGIPTLVEKPIATDVPEAHSIVNLMTRTKTPLFVGYVERFNPVVRLTVELLRSGMLGDLVSLTLRRFGLRPAEPLDVDVIHDLSVHDIDLATLLADEPHLLGAAGSVDPSTSQVHSAQLLLRASGVAVTVETSGIAPRRERTVSILAEGAVATVDLLEQRLDVFPDMSSTLDPRALPALHSCSANEGLMRLTPQPREPLAEQLNAFLSNLAGSADSGLATAVDALGVATIADGASAMIKGEHDAR